MSQTDKVFMVKDDLRPPLEAVLQYEDGTPIDLTSCTVKFHMKKDDTKLIDADAEIVSASEGKVRYNWTSGDTNISGSCKGEFMVTFSDSKTLTLPSKGTLEIIFREKYA